MMQLQQAQLAQLYNQPQLQANDFMSAMAAQGGANASAQEQLTISADGGDTSCDKETKKAVKGKEKKEKKLPAKQQSDVDSSASEHSSSEAKGDSNVSRARGASNKDSKTFPLTVSIPLKRLSRRRRLRFGRAPLYICIEKWNVRLSRLTNSS
jgi:hypothetical protein